MRFILLSTIFLLFQLHSNQSYLDAGVDIAKGNSLIEKIKPLVATTARQGSDASLGGFGGVFDLSVCNYKNPLLVSTCDGVGTKLKIASSQDIHDTIGIDLVAMSINDLLAQGAVPLLFLDYLSTSSLEEIKFKEIIKGIVNGCKQSECSLVGGETAEMPGMYLKGEYDLAGFAVGIVEKEELLPKTIDIQPSDVVIGLGSSGIHSNGFSLVRYILKQNSIDLSEPPPFESIHETLGSLLLKPTTIYVSSILPLVKNRKIKAIANITGGGLIENIPRVLPKDMAVEIDRSSWEIPPVFQWIAELGNVDTLEMFRTFNQGIGMVLIVSKENEATVLQFLEEQKQQAWTIGHVAFKQKDEDRVILKN